MRTIVTLGACAFLLAGAPSGNAATVLIERAPPIIYAADCADIPVIEKSLCLALEAAQPPPCVGTVEERLNCLERRLVFQEHELNRLRQELTRRTTPRIHPLEDQLSRH